MDRPQGTNVIKNRWVFDIKSDGQKKAQLVAKGFSQIEGLDFDQIFSPVVRFETVCLILALAALNKWYIQAVDVHNTYLYGKLDEEIYMEQPEGFHVKGQENKVYWLHRALYGLKQAGLVWWCELDKSMSQLGFKRIQSDASIFICRTKSTYIIAVVYVDDALFCGPDLTLITKVKKQFTDKWECRDLGEPMEFLRMCILHRDNVIMIHQSDYLRKVLECLRLLNTKAAPTPLPAGYHAIPNDAEVDTTLHSRYQMVIGSLIYLMIRTRPDIAFAITALSKHAANPSQDHLDKALYIGRYLLGTQSAYIKYDGSTGKGIMACTDSDWGLDPTAHKSVTGYFLKLVNGIFSWTSHTQKTVALSSTEAEYMVLSDCSCQVV